MDDTKLAEIRKQIDSVDKKLVALLNERARLALQAGIAKGDRQIERPEREAQVIQNAIASNKGPLAEEGIRFIFQKIVEVCRTIQLNK